MGVVGLKILRRHRAAEGAWPHKSNGGVAVEVVLVVENHQASAGAVVVIEAPVLKVLCVVGEPGTPGVSELVRVALGGAARVGPVFLARHGGYLWPIRMSSLSLMRSSSAFCLSKVARLALSIANT